MNTMQVGGIIFRERNEMLEFLLLKRIPEKGGFWQSITGEVENETLLVAVLREAREEAGIKTEDIIQIIKNVNHFEYKNTKKDCIVTEYVFGLEVNLNQEVRLDKNIYKEHDEFKWVSLEDALKLLKWKSSKESMKQLVQMIAQKSE